MTAVLQEGDLAEAARAPRGQGDVQQLVAAAYTAAFDAVFRQIVDSEQHTDATNQVGGVKSGDAWIAAALSGSTSSAAPSPPQQQPQLTAPARFRLAGPPLAQSVRLGSRPGGGNGGGSCRLAAAASAAYGGGGGGVAPAATHVAGVDGGAGSAPDVLEEILASLGALQSGAPLATWPLGTPTSDAENALLTKSMWMLPSGPRRNGEGIDDVFQGVVAAERLNERSAMVCLTLLVAGFIIGPSGISIRAIMSKTGAWIYSWTQTSSLQNGKPVRSFVIEGEPAAITSALGIMIRAMLRYKQLAEGQFSGCRVNRCQEIGGVNFFYQPPPRNIIPYAAGIKLPTPSCVLSSSTNMFTHDSPKNLEIASWPENI